jgi:hypothetical protein
VEWSGGGFKVNLLSCFYPLNGLNLYSALAFFFFFFQEGEIEGSGRVMFGLELQTANGTSEVLVNIHLFHFVSCYSSFPTDIIYIYTHTQHE